MQPRTENDTDVWISIDPGITTGWAVLHQETGRLVATGVWGTADLEHDYLDALIRKLHNEKATVRMAIIEKMPATGKMGSLGIKLERVRHIIYGTLEAYEIPTKEILPGNWKPSRVAKTTVLPRRWDNAPLMIHQKDAIKMGKYAIALQEYE